jgi:hypothetical protein
LPQGRAKRLNVVALKRSELLQDQSLFDRHDDHVRPPLMIRVGADNDGRSLFRGGLIGERKNGTRTTSPKL